MASPTLKIESRPIAGLIPYARNARTHSDQQVAQIAGSIREFGFVNPVLVDPNGGIIAGHGRVLAARKLGLSEVPVIILGHLSETQKRAFMLA
ncbi:MAG: ParB/Srx family N-terminal domain-containing protein [Bryobacteraceae bacterium]|jgi:ParB-like chromosome segregation protein Spo0J